MTLSDGDAIVCISDGVLDLFGDDAQTLHRFEAFMERHSHVAAAVDAIADLAAVTEHPDDVTVLAVTYLPSTNSSAPETAPDTDLDSRAPIAAASTSGADLPAVIEQPPTLA